MDGDAEERPVDDRVQGAIEGLNAAIDRVNLLEDRKAMISAGARRTVSVVGIEMDVLEKQHAPIEQRLVPLMAAREAATAALTAAQQAEERYALALDEVELAREALRLMRDSGGSKAEKKSREVERHLRETQTAAAKRAAALRREARRARAAANAAVRSVGVAGLRLERTAKPLEEAMHLEQEYRVQRENFQTVLGHVDGRITEIEEDKAAAVDLVHSAMWQLETLSNELHSGSERSGRGSGASLGEEGVGVGVVGDDGSDAEEVEAAAGGGEHVGESAMCSTNVQGASSGLEHR